MDVAIPTFRPDGRLDQIIRRLGKQSCPVRHIWLLNTRSGDFPEKYEKMEKVTVKQIEPEEFDHGATRDMAFSLSDAEYMVFMPIQSDIN